MAAIRRRVSDVVAKQLSTRADLAHATTAGGRMYLKHTWWSESESRACAQRAKAYAT